MLPFMFSFGAGFCGGVATVLAVQALAEHKSYHGAAVEDFSTLAGDVHKAVSNLLAEIKKLTGSTTHS